MIEHFGKQESKFQGLARIQARIAMRVITVRQALLRNVHRTAGAFGDVLARHLDMDAPTMRPFGPVDGEETTHLCKDSLKRPRFVTICRLHDIAVHRIA